MIFIALTCCWWPLVGLPIRMYTIYSLLFSCMEFTNILSLFAPLKICLFPQQAPVNVFQTDTKFVHLNWWVYVCVCVCVWVWSWKSVDQFWHKTEKLWSGRDVFWGKSIPGDAVRSPSNKPQVEDLLASWSVGLSCLIYFVLEQVLLAPSFGNLVSKLLNFLMVVPTYSLKLVTYTYFMHVVETSFSCYCRDRLSEDDYVGTCFLNISDISTPGESGKRHPCMFWCWSVSQRNELYHTFTQSISHSYLCSQKGSYRITENFCDKNILRILRISYFS